MLTMSTDGPEPRRDKKGTKNGTGGKGARGRKATRADVSKARTIPLKERESLVDVSMFSKPAYRGMTVKELIARMPSLLAARDLRDIAAAIAKARKAERPVILAFGGHVIKTGLSPVMIGLMEEGVITTMAMNGAAAIHDLEIGLAGMTSEDVGGYLKDGLFGMARETGEHMNAAAVEGRKDGFGAALGARISRFPNSDRSVLAAAHRLGIPATVHVSIGADIVHSHPSADGAAIGEASLTDFKILASQISELEGGVYINLGSAVMMPEVFVKALNLARNLGAKVVRFTAVNMDMIQHYRPRVNVVNRPTSEGGKGYAITGHHEIMFPLLAAAVLEEMDRGGK